MTYIQATSRLGKVRAYMQDALGRIPEALEEVQERLKIFYDERVMHKANSALYVSILDVLGRILLFCKKTAISKPVRSRTVFFHLQQFRKDDTRRVGYRPR